MLATLICFVFKRCLLKNPFIFHRRVREYPSISVTFIPRTIWTRGWGESSGATLMSRFPLASVHKSKTSHFSCFVLRLMCIGGDTVFTSSWLCCVPPLNHSLLRSLLRNSHIRQTEGRSIASTLVQILLPCVDSWEVSDPSGKTVKQSAFGPGPCQDVI